MNYETYLKVLLKQAHRSPNQTFDITGSDLLPLLKLVAPAQALLDHLNPMFIETDEVIVNLKKAVDSIKDKT